MPNKVLLIEDDKAIRFGVARHLARSGFEVIEAEDCETARERFRAFDPQAVVTDFRLPDGEALELIAEFRREKPALSIVVFTGYGTIELAVRALRTGADNLLTKPINMEALVTELRRACHETAPASTLPGPHKTTPGAPYNLTLPGLERDVERLRDADCSVLIQGETGTGKTMLARWIHTSSRRSRDPFIELNCAGLARDLVESELFGHERGAFTSAHAAKPGMFELADGGTLFLDEIGDIDLAVQPKVLKAIEEKRFRRMGSVREQRVDVRVIAATHRDLRVASRANTFRSDLYYRLNTFTIRIPSLRERKDDIAPLSRDFLVSLSSKIGRRVPELAPDAVAALAAHSWPGNVRELKNVLERALHLTHYDVLTARDLLIETSADDEVTPVFTPRHELAPTLQAMERVHLERALAVHGHVGEAARSLGISRSSMYLKLKAYGILPARGSRPRLKVGGDGGA